MYSAVSPSTSCGARRSCSGASLRRGPRATASSIGKSRRRSMTSSPLRRRRLKTPPRAQSHRVRCSSCMLATSRSISASRISPLQGTWRLRAPRQPCGAPLAMARRLRVSRENRASDRNAVAWHSSCAGSPQDLLDARSAYEAAPGVRRRFIAYRRFCGVASEPTRILGLWQSVLIAWEHSQLDVRGVPRRMKHALRRALEVRGLSCVDVLKLLRIPINEGEPAALHADEDAISFLEGVIDVVHGEIYARRLVWPHGYGVAETVAEFSSHHIAPHELLIAAWMNIDQLHNPVRIRPAC